MYRVMAVIDVSPSPAQSTPDLIKQTVQKLYMDFVDQWLKSFH